MDAENCNYRVGRPLANIFWVLTIFSLLVVIIVLESTQYFGGSFELQTAIRIFLYMIFGWLIGLYWVEVVTEPAVFPFFFKNKPGKS